MNKIYLIFQATGQALTIDVGSPQNDGIKVTSGSNKIVRDAQNNGVRNITEVIQGTGAATYNFKADFVNNISNTPLVINALNTSEIDNFSTI